MRVDYKLNDKLDFWLFIPTLILLCFGLAGIYSSTLNNHFAHGNFQKQLFFGGVSIVLFFVIYSLPTNTFKYAAIPTYIFSMLLLMAVLVVGKKTSGARAWLVLGPLGGFQPAEFAKLGTVLAMASYLTKTSVDIESFKDIVITLAIGLFPVGLILLQPDMGTSFVFFGFILVLIFWKGISLFGLYLVLSPGFVAVASLFGIYYFIAAVVIVAAALIYFKKNIFISGSIIAANLGAGFFADSVFTFLSPHQQKRIESFINPSADPLGAGYNAIQAKVAIGSGGFLGKGFLAGNQTQLQYIPEQWTDFIYCVIGEEFGFLGSLIILICFIIIFMRIIKIASSTRDEFLSLVLLGIFTIYFVHLFINIGMTVGIMPVIGIPLPFVSYGGSSLVINMLMLGIVANVHRTRKNYT